jgi:hypothetical protein
MNELFGLFCRLNVNKAINYPTWYLATLISSTHLYFAGPVLGGRYPQQNWVTFTCSFYEYCSMLAVSPLQE